MTPKSERIAIFPGSFNPFTVGHESIVRRGLAICDRILVAVGVNMEKDSGDAEKRVDGIRRIFADEPRVEVTSYAGLTGELVKSTGASFILRGVRNATDFDYETALADANRNMFGVETVILAATPELAWISSSAVRELRHYGKDVSSLLPHTKNN